MHKTAPLVQVKAGPDDGLEEGQFTGYASVFGNKDSYGDVVQPGAFADTLAEWKASGDTLPVYWGHDMADPFSNIGGVLAAEEDEKGLKVTAQLDMDDPKARKVYALLKGRRVSQMSFAYDVVKGAPAKSEELGDYYSLDKLKLYEVSVVPVGANQETEILAVKHLTAAVKAGRVLSAKNETALREARDAIDTVLSSLDSSEDQEKASTSGPAKDEEPPAAKSEEPTRGVSVTTLAAQIELLKIGAPA